ncbi:MAG: ATP-binding cassette domain-containing protein, partial [Gammaproteobacteria bacterium]|nr:ATP-binding cassette domain-containing protein [Gammaproteobacteria bacterium]
MLEINDLSKSFGSLKAVNEISLAFLPNQVVGLLGPNGAGKSTTMRMAAGFLIPDSGTVRICGYD